MKAIRITLLVLIIIGLGLLITQGFWVSPFVNWILKIENARSVSLVATTTETSHLNNSASKAQGCTGLCAPLNRNDYFLGESTFGAIKDGYTSSDGKYTVTFKVLTGSQYQAINDTVDIYVNGTLAGQTGGQGISQVSFSPDNKYLAFRTRNVSGCAGNCLDHDLYVVALSNPLVMNLLNHPATDKNSGKTENQDLFIESYSWGTNDTLYLTSYLVGDGYRITPKQVWSYDLSNPQSVMRNGIFVKTTSE